MHRATPEQWAFTERQAKQHNYTAAMLLELRDRIAALEEAENDRRFRDCKAAIDNSSATLTGSNHPAKPDSSSAPSGGLMELMRFAYESSSGTITNALGEEELPGPGVEEFSAMLDVIADHLNDRGQHMAAALLRQEVQRHG